MPNEETTKVIKQIEELAGGLVKETRLAVDVGATKATTAEARAQVASDKQVVSDRDNTGPTVGGPK